MKIYIDLEMFPTKSYNEHPDFQTRVLRRLEVELAALQLEGDAQESGRTRRPKEGNGRSILGCRGQVEGQMEKWYYMFEPSDIGNFKSDVLAMCFGNTEKMKAACASMERLNYVEKKDEQCKTATRV